MKKTIEISVPTPCTEAWNAMKPIEQGRFCNSCQKKVTDFTDWDEQQLKHFFRSNQGNLCGRFRSDQLKQYPLASQPHPMPARLALLSLLGLATAGSVAAGQDLPQFPVSQVAVLNALLALPVSPQPENLSDSVQYIFRGQVWSQQDSAMLPGVSVVVKGTTMGIATDANGNFEFRWQKPPQLPVTLVFSFIGYMSEEVVIDWKPGTTVELGKVYMVSDVVSITSGIVCYVSSVPSNPVKRLWWKFKGLFN
jgi:hypothetical protein